MFACRDILELLELEYFTFRSDSIHLIQTSLYGHIAQLSGMSEWAVHAFLKEASSSILRKVGVPSLKALILLVKSLVGKILCSVNLAQSCVISVQEA